MDVKDLLQSQKMPWLVPACNKEQALQRDACCLLEDSFIAGLVPHIRFNAHAFVLGSTTNPNWLFEFRTHCGTYSLNQAKAELDEKCKDDEEAQVCNVMLIAITTNLKSEAEAWVVDRGNQQYLRVVVLCAAFKHEEYE